MKRKSIILVGGPETGKSNYVGRLWCSLKEGRGTLKRAGMPPSLEYINSICHHLLQGQFAGRTDTNMARQDFCVPLKIGDDTESTDLIVPDFTGELWRDVVKNSEIPQEWLDELENASGALLFVRAHSPLNIQPLDWVTARDSLRIFGEGNEEMELPTQVTLCELLNLLQQRLSVRADSGKPRVAVVITAWDTLDTEAQLAGPQAYLRKQFPLFAGAIEDVKKIELCIYGVTIVGGDLQRDDAFRMRYQNMVMADCGSVTFIRDGVLNTDPDITIPVAWAIGD